MLKMTNFVSLSTARAARLELLRLKTNKAALVHKQFKISLIISGRKMYVDNRN